MIMSMFMFCVYVYTFLVKLNFLKVYKKKELGAKIEMYIIRSQFLTNFY